MKRTAVVYMVVGLIALVVAGVTAQQVRQTRTGRLVFNELQWDFAHNTIVVTGNPASMVVEGLHKAQLRSPRMEIDADQRLEEIHGATAAGPVSLDLLTAPDVDGRRRRKAEDTVVMSGNVVADIVTLPEGEAEAAHLESETIIVNLGTSTLTARPGTFEVTTEVDLPEEQ